MRIVLLTHWLSNKGGGIPVVVAALARQFARQLSRVPGQDVHVMGLVDDKGETADQDWGNATVHPVIPRESKLIGYAPEMDQRLAELEPDIVHLHGMWTYASSAAGRWRARQPEGRLMISPHGMLEPWALQNSRWKKRIASALFQRNTIAKADCLHALTPAERGEILAYCGPKPVAQIPNGVDEPGPFARLSQARREKTMLYLGRIHPKKNLNYLLDLWAASGAATQNWRLQIAGWDQNGTEAALREQAQSLGIAAQVDFIGPLFGEAKTIALAGADAFVLPSLSEGLPMTVLEAWSHGLPVLMTEACNLPLGFERGAAHRLTLNDPVQGQQDLSTFLQMPQAGLAQMGAAGLDLAREHYLWDSTAKKVLACYEWSAQGQSGAAEKPSFVFV